MKKNTLVVYTALIGTLLVFAPDAAIAEDDTFLNDASFELSLPSDEGGWVPFEVSLFSQD